MIEFIAHSPAGDAYVIRKNGITILHTSSEARPLSDMTAPSVFTNYDLSPPAGRVVFDSAHELETELDYIRTRWFEVHS